MLFLISFQCSRTVMIKGLSERYNNYIVLFLRVICKIIGWWVSRHMSTHLVTATFKATFQERGRPSSLTFNSDRGSQYISKTLTGLLQQYGVKQSFSATAKPLDNAVSEHTERTTPLNSTFAKAWRSTFASTMRCGLTRR